MPQTQPLEPQAALESAVAEVLRQKYGWKDAACRRTFDGQPPAVGWSGFFAAVWSDGRRGSQGRTSLHESFAVNVTVTVRASLPVDRWVELRDRLEELLNGVRALLHADSWNCRVTNLANSLCGWRNPGDALADAPAGFLGGMRFLGFDPVQRVGADWFHADPTVPQAAERNLGLAQTARFGDHERIQSMENLSLG